MGKIIDVTGIIREGMWNYEAPYPRIRIKPMPPVPWADTKVFCEVFEGMHSQTGTYLETPAHFFGNDDPRTCLLINVPVEKLVNVPCVVLNIGMIEKKPEKKRHGISVADLEGCQNAREIRAGDAILVGTGWGRYWMDEDYLDAGPYFARDAMDWLIAKRPAILGGDSARWENLEQPQGFFPDFYAADILMAGPLVNLEEVTSPRCRLTALPLKIAGTCASPARVVITEE